MDQRNVIVAILISLAILLGFQFFYEMPRLRQQEALQQQQSASQQQAAPPAGVAPPPVAGGTAPGTVKAREQALAEGARLRIDSARVTGSLALDGARLDDLILDDYKVTTARSSPNIVLLTPRGAADAYYAEFGWLPADGSVPVPGPDTPWQTGGDRLSPDQPVDAHLGQWPGAGLRAHHRAGPRLPVHRHRPGPQRRRRARSPSIPMPASCAPARPRPWVSTSCMRG